MSSKKTVAGVQIEGEATAEVKEAFGAMQAQWGMSKQRSSSSSTALVATETPQTQQVTTKAAGSGKESQEWVKNVTKAHGEWDRAKRMFLGTLAMSLKNVHTNDTTMQKELEEMCAKGSEISYFLRYLNFLKIS